MTTQTLTLHRLRSLENSPRIPALAQFFVLAATVVTKWAMLGRTRYHLGQLPPHLLSDIGITPDEAKRECSKNFWLD